jgi:hypothetical protein
MRRVIVVSTLASVGWMGCNTIDDRSGGPYEVVGVEPTTSSATDSTSLPPPACGDRVDADGDGFTRPSTAACAGDAGASLPFSSMDDCDDEDATQQVAASYWLDRDGDGSGSTAVIWSCEGDIPPGAVDNTSDCDDTDPSARVMRYPDADGDGFGALEGGLCLEGDAPGYVAAAYDCDDTDPSRRPELPEVNYDGADSNCDGYDVQVARTDATDPPALDGAPWCEGPALAVVALHRVLWFITELEVANVGTERVSGARANVTSYDPSFTTAGSVQTLEIDELEPGQSYRTRRFTGGSFVLEFSYEAASIGDAGRWFDAAPPTDTGDAGTWDAETWDAGTGNAVATNPASGDERCERAQAPFSFTVPHHVWAL